MAAFARGYAIMGAQRATKILGIFARLCHRDGKDGYLKDMPRVMAYLRRTCARYAALAPLGLGPFPMLNSTFGTMVGYLTLCLPLVILLQLFSLIFVDRTLIEAAHNLRCARLRTVFEVVVPAARVGPSCNSSSSPSGVLETVRRI